MDIVERLKDVFDRHATCKCGGSMGDCDNHDFQWSPTPETQLVDDAMQEINRVRAERDALIVINDQMDKQGSEIAPYWAHYMMAEVLRKTPCQSGPDTCRTSSLCITEYCAGCYARIWWESQHAHKAQAKRYRDGMPKKAVNP